MYDMANKRPTLQMRWEVLGNGECATRALAFTSAKARVDSAEKAGVRPTNSIAVGDRLRLELQSDIDGYLTLFDFGTSGRFTKLFPNPGLSTVNNHIVAGKAYAAPGELLPILLGLAQPVGPRLRSCLGDNRGKDVVAVLFDDACTRGGFGAVEETISSLLDLPEEDWSYGLLETEVVQ